MRNRLNSYRRSLMLKGLSPGTALVLLMAGPAVNAASMIIVGKSLGRKTLLLYIVSIVIGSILFGLAVDYLLPSSWFALTDRTAASTKGIGLLEILAGATFTILLVIAIVRRVIPKKVSSYTYKVSGMRCNHCREAVEKAVKNVPGVESVQVTLNPPTISVTGTASEKDIFDAVASVGFSIENE